MDEQRCSDVPRLIRVAVIAAAILLFISISARSAAAWKYWGDLNHNSPGTWLCMAADASDGILYRPIVSEIGYGGTRYAPLFPIVIAGFMRLGINPVASGFLAGLFATALTIGGLFALMRRLGTPVAIAAALAVFVLAATCTRTIILGIKGDLLPAGLALWGLAAIVWSGEKRDSPLGLITGAIFFAAALAAKITSVFGITAATIWLLFRRKFRQAAILLFAWVVGVIAVAIITQWASNGRAMTIFLMCAGGGGGFTAMLSGPHRLLREALGQDHILVAIWAIAMFVIAMTRLWTSLPAILLLVATAGTIVIYGSPGTHINHFVDMNAAAILVIGTLGLKTRKLRSAVLVVTLILMGVAAISCLRQVREIRRDNERQQMTATIADTERSIAKGPILAEDPLLPLIAGQRPYMLDPFMFRAIRSRKTEIADQFWRDLDTRHFKAVILHKPPSDPSFSADDNDFGPGFIDRLEQGYALSSVHGDFYVLLPKPELR
jgi:hypothetical protein